MLCARIAFCTDKMLYKLECCYWITPPYHFKVSCCVSIHSCSSLLHQESKSIHDLYTTTSMESYHTILFVASTYNRKIVLAPILSNGHLYLPSYVNVIGFCDCRRITSVNVILINLSGHLLSEISIIKLCQFFKFISHDSSAWLGTSVMRNQCHHCVSARSTLLLWCFLSTARMLLYFNLQNASPLLNHSLMVLLVSNTFF